VFPTDYEKCYNAIHKKIMRHKCRYGGSNNSLIGSIHTIK